MNGRLVIKVKLKRLDYNRNHWQLACCSFIINHTIYNGVDYDTIERYMAIDGTNIPQFMSDELEKTAPIRYELPNISDDTNAEPQYRIQDIIMRFDIGVAEEDPNRGKFWLLANMDSKNVNSATKHFASPPLDPDIPREFIIIMNNPIEEIVGFTIASNQPASIKITYNDITLLETDYEDKTSDIARYRFCEMGENLLDIVNKNTPIIPLVKFNSILDLALDDILSIAKFAGVLTFTESNIVVGLGTKMLKFPFIDINPDTSNVMLMNENQEIPSFKSFTNLLKYEPTTTRSVLEDFLDNEVIPTSIFKNKVTHYSINNANETYTESKTFTAPIRYNISNDSVATLGTFEIPTTYLITKKLREYVLLRTAMSFLRFLGTIDSEDDFPTNPEVGDVYQITSNHSMYAYSANGWLLLSSDEEINLDFLADLSKPNEFFEPNIFRTSILLKHLNQNILKADSSSIDIGVPLLSNQEQINIESSEFLTKGFIENHPQTFTGELTFKETFTPIIEQEPVEDDDIATLEYLNNSINAVTAVGGEPLIGTTEPNVFNVPVGKLWINYGYDVDNNLKPQIWIKTKDGWYNLHSQTLIEAHHYRIEVDFTKHSSTRYNAIGCKSFRLLFRNDEQPTGYDQLYATSITPTNWSKATDTADVIWNVNGLTCGALATLPVGCYANSSSYPKASIFKSTGYGWLSEPVYEKKTMTLEFPMLPPSFMGVAYQSRSTNTSPAITGATSVRIYKNDTLIKSQDFPSNVGGNIVVTF